MATSGSEVTTSRIRPASRSNYSRSICNSEGIGLEEAIHPRDAVSSPSQARPPWDELFSCNSKDHPSDCQGCRELSEETGRPAHCLGLLYTTPFCRPDASAMANEALGIIDEPTRVPTNSRYHRSLLQRSFMGAVPVPSPASPPGNDIVSYDLEDHPLDFQARGDFSEESSHPMQCPGLPSTKPSSRPNSSETTNEAIGIDDEPTSDPTRLHYYPSLHPSIKAARCFEYVTSIPSKVCHRWFGSLLGLSTLTLAIVSLLMFTVRSYRMAVWTTRNDELQACTGLIQVRDSPSSELC